MNTKISHFKLLKIADNAKLLIKPKKTKELQKLMTEYTLTLEEATLFTFLLAKSIEGHRVSMSDLEDDTIKTGNKIFLQLLKTLKLLVKKDMIVLDKRRGRNELLDPLIEIDEGVFSMIVLGEELFSGIDFESAFSIIEAVNDLIEKRDEKKVSEQRFFKEFDILVKKINKELPLYSILVKYKRIEQLMIFKACIEKIRGYGTEDCNRFFSDIYDSIADVAENMKSIYKGSLKSIKDKVLALEEDSPFRNDPSFDITDKYYEKIFEGKFKKKTKEFNPKYTELIKHNKIKSELFFDKEIAEQVDILSYATSKKQFTQISKELKKANFPSGIISLFHGYPGTGKTAAVHAIAQKTKRDILQVDISNINDKYVGESEKRLKEVFNEYSKAKKALSHTPILLFNEADALIGQRITVKDSVDQMNNTMQNILLEELEKFDGIFFATTNLTENMDDAFNRRFLYKVEFQKPSREIRNYIWKSKIKDIPSHVLKEISEFDFSGGQIENVARKFMIDKILKNKKNYDGLNKMCVTENSFKKQKAFKIGFM
ncbi:MAG: ATP-binding protein [Candidatus Delongbacteria bacterium]|jgi:SpoVK/Ycf46/Vps4 family AAA+-type ATPase|nr:ATP-binding protein [Candidatus Delongbacteria bacterium]